MEARQLRHCSKEKAAAEANAAAEARAGPAAKAEAAIKTMARFQELCWHCDERIRGSEKHTCSVCK